MKNAVSTMLKGFLFLFLTNFFFPRHPVRICITQTCSKSEFLRLLDWSKPFILQQFQLKPSCLRVAHCLPGAHASCDAPQSPPSGRGFAMGTVSLQRHYESCSL